MPLRTGAANLGQLAGDVDGDAVVNDDEDGGSDDSGDSGDDAVRYRGLDPPGGDGPGGDDDGDDGEDGDDRVRASRRCWIRRIRGAAAGTTPLFSFFSGNPSRWGPAAKGFIASSSHDAVGLSETQRGIEALPALERERIASRSSHWSPAVPLHGASTQGGGGVV